MATRSMGMMGGARQTKTDASGSYRFDHLPPGAWQLMMLDPQNPMVPSGMASVTVKDGEVVRHDFTKKVGNRTVGGGALRDGKPLANVPVILMGGTAGMKMATTGDDGRFSFDGLEAGEYTVLVQSAMLGGGSASRKVKVGAEGKVEDVNLELTSMAVEGDVVDAEDGKPVAGAQVSLLDVAAGGKIGSGEDLIAQYRGQAMADERGHFVIKDVQAGSFTLRVSAQGFSAATLDAVAAGTRTVRVQLQRGVEFPVTVTGPDGRPLQGATVQSVDASGRESLSMDMTLSGITSQDGVAHLRLVPGTYRINVNAPNLLPASAEVDTATGAASIRLSAGATVEVTVKNADGLLVANAKVKVLDASGQEIKQGFTVASFMGGGDVTNTDGLFTRGGLPAGAATLVVTDPAGREARAEATLVSDKTTRAEVTVK